MAQPRRGALFLLSVAAFVALILIPPLNGSDPWVTTPLFVGGGLLGFLMTAMIESVRGYAARRSEKTLDRVDGLIALALGLLVIATFASTYLNSVPRFLSGMGAALLLGFFLSQQLLSDQVAEAPSADDEEENDAIAKENERQRRGTEFPPPGSVEDMRRIAEWNAGVQKADALPTGALLDAVHDVNPGTRWRVLDRLRAEMSDDARTHSALAAALDDEHSDVSGQALVQLVNLASELRKDDRDAIVATIRAALEHESEEVRRWVAQELGEL